MLEVLRPLALSHGIDRKGNETVVREVDADGLIRLLKAPGIPMSAHEHYRRRASRETLRHVTVRRDREVRQRFVDQVLDRELRALRPGYHTRLEGGALRRQPANGIEEIPTDTRPSRLERSNTLQRRLLAFLLAKMNLRAAAQVGDHLIMHFVKGVHVGAECLHNRFYVPIFSQSSSAVCQTNRLPNRSRNRRHTSRRIMMPVPVFIDINV